MKKVSAVVLLLLCLSTTLFTFAFAGYISQPASQPPNKLSEGPKSATQEPQKTDEVDNLKIRIAVLEKTNELTNKVDAVKSQFDALDKHVDRVINIAGISATLFGIVFAILGFLVRQDAKEAAKETVKIRDEAKKHLESIEALHGQAEQKAKDLDDLVKKMKDSGEKPSYVIVNGLKQEFDNLSGELAATLSKASVEKDKISVEIEKQLTAAKEVAEFLERQGKILPASHYFNLGYAAWKNGKMGEAIRLNTLVIELDQGLAVYAYNNRAIALVEQGFCEKAIADFDEAIRLKPDYVPAYLGKAEALICLSKYDESETMLIANMGRFTGNENVGIVLYLLRLALTAQEKDDTPAETDYETLLKNNPSLNFKGWYCKPIKNKLAEIERKNELPRQIEKMKAIHDKFMELVK